MAINKKFLTLPKVATPDSTSQNVDFFGDGTGRRLYTFNRDNSEEGGNLNYAEVNVENGLDGKIGWGMYMDGTNLSGGSGGSYIDTTADFVPTSGSFTISFWHKPTYTFGYLIARGFVSDPLGGMAISIYTDGGTTGYHRYGFYRNVGSNSSSTAYASAEFSDSLSTTSGNTNWYHIVVSYNSSNNTVMFMRNGAVGTTVYKRASDNATGVFSAMNSGTIVFGIGGSYDYPGRQRIGNRSNSNSGSTLSNSPYFGFINQLRVFDKAVTSTEGTSLSNETIGTWTGTTDTHLFSCVLNYNLDNSAKESMGASSYDGTESNISYKLGKFGAAASFNGSTSYINTNYTIPSTTTFSWSGWIKTSNTKTQYISADFNAAGANANHRFSVRLDGSNLKASINDSGGGLGSLVTFGTYAKYGVWAHVVVTVNGTSVKGYVNGSQLGSTQTASLSMAAGVEPLVFGAYGPISSTHSATFDGEIDQVRIYTTELSATEVASLYAEKYTYITKNADQPFGDSSCIAYYKFENNSNDSIGTYNATNNNVTYTTTDAAFGSYAGVFNGTNAYYSLGQSLRTTLNNNFSISFWMKTPNSTFTNTQAHISGYYYPGYGSASGWEVYTYNDILYFYWVSSITVGNNVAASTGYGSSPNLWFHVVVTKTSSAAKIYVNGNYAVASTAVTGNGMYLTGVSTSGVVIGNRYSTTYKNYSSHSYDQIRFFNRELTGVEVAQLHEEKVYG